MQTNAIVSKLDEDVQMQERKFKPYNHNFN